MSGISIITGGGTGIGAALAKRLVSRSQKVLIVGRRADKLLETQAQCSPSTTTTTAINSTSSSSSLIHTVVADVSKPEGRDAIVESLREHNETQIDNLIHNAAVLEPIGPLMDVSVEDWRKHFEINVEGPLFLTKTLLPFIKQGGGVDGLMRGGRVLHISSGAAHHGYRGWVS